MILGNGSKGKLVARHVVVVRGRLGRLRGLLGRGRLRTEDALLFAGGAVHTLGARDAVDLAWLDASMRVLRVERRLPPRRFPPAVERAAFVLVTEAGGLDPECAEPGDRLEWVPRTSDRVRAGAGPPPEFAHLVKDLPPLPAGPDEQTEEG